MTEQNAAITESEPKSCILAEMDNILTLADATTFFETTQPIPPGFFGGNLPIDGEERSQRIVTEQILNNPEMAAHLFDEL